jgi:membrane AbrB-like protein
MSLPHLRAFVLTLVVGGAGALLAYALAFPAPFLIGPALAVTIASLCGLRLVVLQEVRNVCFVIIGVSMGTGLTPEVIVAAKTWPLSFVMVLVTVVIVLHAGAWVLQKMFGYDRVTALLAASPGHLAYVMSLAAETRSDLPTVGVIQSVRVLALTLTVPLIVQFFELVSAEPAVVIAPMHVLVLAATLAAAVVLGFLFLRWRFPAALLLGGVVAAGATHVTGFVSGGVPSWVLTPTYVVLGCVIGTRFSGVAISQLKTAFVAGVVLTIAVTVLAAAMAAGVSYLTGVPLDAALIAFSPGGLETMAAMAVMMNAQPTYVGAHHVLRLMFLSVLMPLVLGKDARR